MFLIMDNDMIQSPISVVWTTGISNDLLLVGGVMIIIVLSSIFNLSSSLPDQSAFATFPGENGKIAFSSSRDGGNVAIYMMNADGSNPTRLTTRDASNQYPDWSPDGTKIAFSGAEY